MLGQKAEKILHFFLKKKKLVKVTGTAPVFHLRARALWYLLSLILRVRVATW
jgi:hypothetical protein